jgi:hypothetical protein
LKLKAKLKGDSSCFSFNRWQTRSTMVEEEQEEEEEEEEKEDEKQQEIW